MKNGKFELKDGDLLTKDCMVTENCNAWYKNDQLHREDGPSIEWFNGDKEWFMNGKPHRDGAPAVEYSDGGLCYYQNGKLHREGGPAVALASGEKNWYINGKLHREDGPAFIDPDDNKAWYLNGKYHNGSTVEVPDGVNDGLLHGSSCPQKDLPINSVKRIESDVAKLDDQQLKQVSEIVKRMQEFRQPSSLKNSPKPKK